MSGTMFAASPTIAMRSARFHGRQHEVEAASIAIRRGNGVLVIGSAGSGVTSLLEHISSLFSNRHVVRVLPGRLDARLGSVDSGRSIVVADDVDGLDRDTQRRMEGLARRRKVTLVAGTASHRCGHADSQVCWHNAGMRRIWLDALPASAALAIIEDLLVGDVDGPTFQSLIDLAAGLPRDLIDLLVGSHQVGLVVPTARGWSLTGNPSTHLVRSTTVERVEAMSTEVRLAARQLATVLPLPMRTVHTAVGTPVLRSLFDVGLLIDQLGRDVTLVDFARPLDAVLLRERW